MEVRWMENKQRNTIFAASPSSRVPRLIALLAVLLCLVFISTFCFYDYLKLRAFLLWNIFLAVFPLLFALLICRLERLSKRSVLSIPLWILWLFFFPNAPYMITDLIHLERYTYYVSGVGFNPDVAVWFGLLHLVTGILVGCVCGMLSLYLLQNIVRRRFGWKWGWLLSALTSVLSGIGIYIGRFMRFNSWDLAARPLSVAQRIWDSLGADTFLLYLIFSIMTFVPYALFYICFDNTFKNDCRPL